jgi:hypothetical protein
MSANASTSAPALPRQELLKKLLMMTTSTNDGEALTALRKANNILTEAGWDWNRLVDGKITVVEDPFRNLGTPPSHGSSTMNGGGASSSPPRRPTAPPPPPRQGTSANPISSTPNRFPQSCHCCGIEVVTGAGYIFKVDPADLKWACICTSCNTTAVVYRNAAAPRRAKGKRNVSDLA